jgi:carbon storage regulator CsrA
MLVLTRKERETVVLANEITVTVEEISDRDGQPLSGGAVRLGFQCPGHISIERSECRVKGLGAAHSGETTRPAQPPAAYSGNTTRPAQPPAGRASLVSDAQVRLRIQVPRRVPVCLNGTPTAGLDSEERPSDATHTTTALHRITCRLEDRVTICKNITIAAVAFRRFDFYHDPVTGR